MHTRAPYGPALCNWGDSRWALGGEVGVRWNLAGCGFMPSARSSNAEYAGCSWNCLHTGIIVPHRHTQAGSAPCSADSDCGIPKLGPLPAPLTLTVAYPSQIRSL
eukprot:364599-Chlamydomonas_euryale.AAC.10